MIRITQPLAEQLFKAYCELFGAVENGIDNDIFFELRKRFRNLQSQVLDHAIEQDQLSLYRAFAHSEHNNDGHLEVEDSAIVSVSDGGAYVESWLWVEAESIMIEGEGDIVE